MIMCLGTGKLVQVSELLFGLRMDTLSDVEKMIRKLEAKIEAFHSESSQERRVIIEEIGQGTALMQRGFTGLFNSIQGLSESHCPNVFAVLPKEGNRWVQNIFGQKMVVQLYCQAPGEWHPTLEGGQYEIKKPAEWLRAMGPYIVKLAKVIKYAAPVAGAAASLYAGPIAAVMGAGFAEKLAKQIKLMEELAKKIGEERDFLRLDRAEGRGGSPPSWGQGGQTERVEGAALRALRQLLDEVDPAQDWGGLKKILTPEGHYLWLCEYHAEEYRK